MPLCGPTCKSESWKDSIKLSSKLRWVWQQSKVKTQLDTASDKTIYAKYEQISLGYNRPLSVIVSWCAVQHVNSISSY